MVMSSLWKPIDTAPKDGTPVLTDAGLAKYHYTWHMCTEQGMGVCWEDRVDVEPTCWIHLHERHLLLGTNETT